ncbi:hypothetical protein [Clostridium tarantellae]|uniref:Uncharacterized protein n=1 Tax=Clostridium tarantellae TaxID=39493 RepID=A0A6I1MKW1_9CLOT|nr:hypothetical protein [Clostridium tarantellae]MPQ42842.1 hypothetical protein [Clostridium tarantellae]
MNRGIKNENIENLKRIFSKSILEYIKISNEKNKEIGKKLKVRIPQEFLEAMKNGELNLMKSKTGEILPNIVDDKNKIVKQIRLEEVKEDLNNTDINKLGEYVLEQKLDAIKDQLECIMIVVEDIEKGQKNDRYAKVDGAKNDIKQSLLEDNLDIKNNLQSLAQSKLNEVIEVLSKEINDGIEFFNEWEKRSFIEKNIVSVKFSTWNINRKFNKICEDYLYFNRAKSLLINLKTSQGMHEYKINQIIEDLIEMDIKLQEINISNWLAPKNDSNEWQYTLLGKKEYKNELIIEYDMTEFMKEGIKI